MEIQPVAEETPVVESQENVSPEGEQAIAEALTEAHGSPAPAKPTPAASARQRAARATTEASEAEDETLEGLDDDGAGSDTDEGGDDEPQQQPARTTREASATLPADLRQAARRMGWDDSRIDRVMKLDPDGAVEMFQHMKSTANDLSSQFARLGQAFAQQGQPVPTAPARPAQQGAPQQRPTPPAQGVEDDILADIFGDRQHWTVKYGEDFEKDVVHPLMQRVVGPLNEAIQFVQQQKSELVRSQVDGFFTGIKQDWAERYGEGRMDQVSAEQQRSRMEVAQLADQIRAGAASQGMNMSVAEALERAHMLATSEAQAANARRNLTKQVQTRSRKITARPNQRRRPTASESQEQSLNAAQRAYAEAASEMGLNLGDDLD